LYVVKAAILDQLAKIAELDSCLVELEAELGPMEIRKWWPPGKLADELSTGSGPHSGTRSGAA